MRGIVALFMTTLRRIFATPLSGFLNILVIGIALSLPAGMYVLLKNAHGLVEHLAAAPQISLFLDSKTAEDDLEHLQQQLVDNPGVSRFEFIDRDQALVQVKESSGLEDVIGGLKHNPLPHTFIVYPQTRDGAQLETLRSQLASLPRVEIAQLDTVWAYRLEALLDFGRSAVFILATLLSLALVAITFNTIRLQIMTQRDEIEVSRLIGATNSFVRRPFLSFGLVQGLLGGLMAWLIISIALLLLNQPLATLSDLYAAELTLQALSWGDSLSLLLFSMYLGWLGAWLSVVRHLSRIEPR